MVPGRLAPAEIRRSWARTGLVKVSEATRASERTVTSTVLVRSPGSNERVPEVVV
jgi:hypothetical protein